MEERFEISGLGLVLVPDFPVPEDRWKNFVGKVVVLKPDGGKCEATAHFNMSHRCFGDSGVPVEKRWRVVVSLPDGTKEGVPVGSKILVSPEVRDRIATGDVV